MDWLWQDCIIFVLIDLKHKFSFHLLLAKAATLFLFIGIFMNLKEICREIWLSRLKYDSISQLLNKESLINHSITIDHYYFLWY